VPAGNRRFLCAQRDDRIRSRRPAQRSPGGRSYAVEQRQGAEDRALPAVPDRAVEQLRRRRRCRSFRPRRHARQARSPAARHSHLHVLEAALGGASARHADGKGILRPRKVLAESEPQAAPCLARAQPITMIERCILLGVALAVAGPSAAQQNDPPNGLFLIARPGLEDPNFRQTVVLVTQARDYSTVGIIINRPSELKLERLLRDDSLRGRYGDAVFFGGPVMPQVIVGLFRSES